MVNRKKRTHQSATQIAETIRRYLIDIDVGEAPVCAEADLAEYLCQQALRIAEWLEVYGVRPVGYVTSNGTVFAPEDVTIVYPGGIAPREGILTVYDHEGRYMGCIGSETWQDMLARGAANSQEREQIGVITHAEYCNCLICGGTGL